MRLFSIEEANSFIPTISELLPQMQTISKNIVDALRALAEEMGTVVADPKVQFEAYKHPELSKLGFELDALIKRVEGQGIIIRSISRGIVDFPSMVGGQIIFLCWKKGETEIGYWHDMNGAFPGRKLLVELSTLEEPTQRAQVH